MAKVSKNLGLVSAIHVGTTAPSNIAMIWYNLSDGLHYYYNLSTTSWTLLGQSNSITGTLTNTLVPKATGTNTIGDSQITDNGTTVSINGAATSNKALLELLSTTKGILIPRLTTTQINAIVVGATENSLLVFDTTIGKFKFYDHLSTSWKIIESSTTGGETLADVLTNGNDAQGTLILLNGAGASLTASLGQFGTINAFLKATGIMTLETGRNFIDFKGSAEILRHDISALDGSASSRPVVATWQNKSITVAGLDDITNALAAYLKLDGSTPMTGDLDMALHKILCETIVSVYNDYIQFENGDGNNAIFDLSGLSTDRNFTFPNTSGTIALTSDLATYLPLSGGTMSGDINMQFHKLVFTSYNSQIQSGGRLLLTDGVKSMGLEFSAVTGSKNIMFQDASGTIALLSDITSALAAYLKLNGSAPMTGDLDMLTNGVAVRTNKIKTTAGVLDLLFGPDVLKLDFSAISGGMGSYLQTFRAKNGVIAHLDDSHYYIVGVHNEDVSHMGTSEAVLAIIPIPANTYINDDMFILDVINGKIGSVAGNCFVKCYINTLPSLAGSPIMIAQQQFNATHISGGIGRKMLVRTGSLVNAFTAANTFDNYYQRTTNLPNVISSLDFTNDQYLVISGVSGDANDGAILHSCVLSRLRKTY